ncbi:hypothetical protein LPJ79_002181 [Coemansia sp. RSA 1821]|nr:hypothetical protein LPJ68_002265 [Coemansia sp. RSA 1086]KAJ1751306.1 hypothetical protein LPJ79_002181 [Coemansia sp. RSA 1821]
MAAIFSASRFVQLLRDQVSFLGVISKRARRAIKFGTVPLAYANSTPPTDSTADHIEEILNKSQINEQIPVKPIYIAPRNPVVLCHGPERLPMLQIHYWRGIREALEKIGAKVVIAKVPGTGGIRERAQQLDTLLDSRLASEQVNIVGHSMGGLDARYLITHINPKTYSVASLTTVCTPHRGSPFMDWCRDYLSLGYRVDPDQLIRDFAMVWKPSTTKNVMRTSTPTISDAMLQDRINSIINHAIGNCNASGIDPADSRLQEFSQFLTRLLGENASVGETSQLAHMARKSAKELDYLGRSMELLKMVYRRVMATLDTPAYACLTTDYCQQFFNPSTPDAPGVEYLSIGAHMDPADISDKVNPLIIPHDIIYKSEGPNDGFVSLSSAQWGHYLGSVCADHFDFTNRWRLTSLGRDFIGTMAYWSSKWSSWLSHKNGQADSPSKPPTNANDAEAFKEQVNFNKNRSRFDPIEFYLRLSTILYQRGF